MLKPVEKQRVAEEIVEQLRELILTGQYEPGQKLKPERELAKTLGVNRASLREALKKLEHLGLVRIRQGDGTRVQDFMKTGGIELVSHLLPLAASTHPGIVRDLLEFRRIYGREAARLAAERATEANLDAMRKLADKVTESIPAAELFELDFEFYVLITGGTGNQVMGLLINTVRDAAKSYTPVLVHLIAPRTEVRQHHQDIIAAIAARDADRAAKVANDYLERGAQRVIKMMTVGQLGVATAAKDSESSQGAVAGVAPSGPVTDTSPDSL